MASTSDLKGIRAKLEVGLSGLSQRLQAEADTIDLGDAATNAIINSLAEIPGALDIASRMVSGAMFQGIGATFDAAAPDIDAQAGGGGGNGWDYTAVMDGATCPTCEAWDGTHFDTWDEIAGPDGPLPDGGPNPDCDGDGRCRCRPTIA